MNVYKSLKRVSDVVYTENFINKLYQYFNKVKNYTKNYKYKQF